MTDIETMIQTYEQFKIRERFTTTSRNEGIHSIITVHDNGKEIYEYRRNYGFLKTFEPFRWWNDEKSRWEYYALISPIYTGFQLLNLTDITIVYSFNGNADSFCPISFYVPDHEDYIEGETIIENDSFFKELFETSHKRRFAFVQGCVWGDDSTMKIETIDIHGILSGRKDVRTEQSFGYFVYNGEISELFDGGEVSSYFFDPEVERLSLNSPVSFKLNGDNTFEKLDCSF